MPWNGAVVRWCTTATSPTVRARRPPRRRACYGHAGHFDPFSTLGYSEGRASRKGVATLNLPRGEHAAGHTMPGSRRQHLPKAAAAEPRTLTAIRGPEQPQPMLSAVDRFGLYGKPFPCLA